MLPPMTDADIEQSEHEAEQKEQWEAEHPGQVYQGCSPIRKLKPGYVIDKAGHVVLAATANNKQTNSAADEYTPIKN